MNKLSNKYNLFKVLEWDALKWENRILSKYVWFIMILHKS
jgi:hypothetical protein